LYRDCQDLARYIARARGEIARLRPHELKTDRLPRAGRELDTIVRETESATNEIMAAAEEIMAADSSDPDAFKSLVDTNCLRIFEACSFQDITGQRIRKVVSTLTHIEDRLEGLLRIMGPDVHDAPTDGQPVGDAKLLHGPQLHGEGIAQATVDEIMAAARAEPASAPAPAPKADNSQDDIDALFDDPPAAAPPPSPAPPPPKPAAKAAAPAPAPKPAAPKAEPKPPPKPEPKPEPPKAAAKPAAPPPPPPPPADPKKENNQDEIDALFGDGPQPGQSLDQSAIDSLFD
jgi:chemotaxis protein CheZ